MHLKKLVGILEEKLEDSLSSDKYIFRGRKTKC